MEEKQVFSVGDIAKRWGVSRATVLRIIEEKKIPALIVRQTDIRTVYRIKLTDVLSFEEQGATIKTDDASRMMEAAA